MRIKFGNGLRKETEILVEKFFRSFVFYFNIKKKKVASGYTLCH